MARLATCFTLFALVAVASADLKFDEGDKSKVVLASFGSASDSVSVLYRGTDSSATPTVTFLESELELFTAGTISSAPAAGGYTNYTIPLTFESGVGSASYQVSIGDESITGSCIVAGFQITDEDGLILSGDEGPGVSHGQSGSTTYSVKAVGIDGAPVDISGTDIVPKAVSGPYFKELDLTRTTITSEIFTHTVATYRVGTGKYIINFETTAIELFGESFETVLHVAQDTTDPPCVAIGGAATEKNGFIIVPMFNLLAPPRPEAVKSVVISIGDESAEWDTSESDLSVPDQSVYFPISASGTATITCDGELAKIMGDDITSSGGPLATTLVATLPDDDNLARFDWTVRVKDSSPEVLSAPDGQAILDKTCDVISGKNCVIESVKSGSAVLGCAARVDEDEASNSKDELEACFAEPECKCQTDLGYTCDELTLEGVNVVKAVGSQGAAAGGLATWTIALIAGVGAFALILVIVLGLWAVYRRSAEQSESDYSSSGPLGVPDPSDLLYEQSIVRDIYGRGDFPDGGPSQAVAEQRAREAALREEFPRPPSSSGLSRGTGTDDASSTYSV